MNTKILIVEDGPDLRQILADLLRSNGYEVDVAGDGEEALTRISASRPDLVLSDMRMPKMDGPTLKKSLSENPATADIPIIFMSAYVREHQQIDVQVIPKPFTIRQLISAITTAL